MACDGTCSARSSAEQLLHVGPFEHVRRQGAQRLLDSHRPAAHVTGAATERLVETEVHARRHGAEAVGLGSEVTAGELGGPARGVQVAHRRQRQRVARRRAGEVLLGHTEVTPRPSPYRQRGGQVVEADLVEGEEELEIGARPVDDLVVDGEGDAVLHRQGDRALCRRAGGGRARLGPPLPTRARGAWRPPPRRAWRRTPAPPRHRRRRASRGRRPHRRG